jgi:hypothetical protein
MNKMDKECRDALLLAKHMVAENESFLICYNRDAYTEDEFQESSTRVYTTLLDIFQHALRQSMWKVLLRREREMTWLENAVADNLFPYMTNHPLYRDIYDDVIARHDRRGRSVCIVCGRALRKRKIPCGSCKQVWYCTGRCYAEDLRHLTHTQTECQIFIGNE